MIIYREQLRQSVDKESQAGEGLTVRIGVDRCRRCGGLIEEIYDCYGLVVAVRCRGCGRRIVR